jgi:hypothetical protein
MRATESIHNKPLDLARLIPSESAKATELSSWSEILSRVSQLSKMSAAPGVRPERSLDHLSGLLKLQADIGQYQLRVELVSKVSESAVASVRKLQQNQ